jgi:asparagine synthase (glutamine-hydrolysing)
MCGIAGIHLRAAYFSHGDGLFCGEERALEKVMERMLAGLKHRGPDDRGQIVHRGERTVTSLGHTRLSIIDLSPAGHQPMWSEDQRFCLTYNGEIYNYKELRGKLSKEVKGWNSHTDTEVLLRAYERWGLGCLQSVRGMFAFGIWDKQEEQLILGRDPFGIKPLYYYADKDIFIFASEVNALLSTGLIPKRVSIEGVTSYLQSGSVESPLTIVQGLRSLQPGHLLIVKSGQAGLEAEEVNYAGDFFARPQTKQVSDRKEAVNILRTKLEDSVRLHLISDVPLAAFLSGGIDSSAIIALMSRVSEVRPKTFSVVFAESKFNESSYARLIAERFGTEHKEIPLSENDLFSILPDALSSLDQPTMDGINSYVISKAVKQAGITVALSGLGGDELFAGYPSFHRMRRMQGLGSIPAPLRKITARIGQATLGGSTQQKKAWDLLSEGATARNTYRISRRLFSGDSVSALLGREGGFSRSELYKSYPMNEDLADSINAMSLYEIRGYMANTLLRDTDQMSMAHSLEVRVPFIDIEVARFVLSLPGEWKMNGGRQKPLLQDALGDLLPPEVKNRAKMGFTIPFEGWMQSRLRDDLDSAFADKKQFESIGLRPGIVREIWQRFLRSPQKVGWSRPWALYVLGRWCTQNRVTL